MFNIIVSFFIGTVILGIVIWQFAINNIPAPPGVFQVLIAFICLLVGWLISLYLKAIIWPKLPNE